MQGLEKPQPPVHHEKNTSFMNFLFRAVLLSIVNAHRLPLLYMPSEKY